MTVSLEERVAEQQRALEAHTGNGKRDQEPVLVYVNEIEPQTVTWLWPSRIPAGKLTVVEGDPGLGKSTLLLDLAARVTSGRAMPDGTAGMDGSALVLTGEDGPADTVRPRLEAAGADLQRVAILTAVEREGQAQPPTFPDDQEALRRAIVGVGACLVVIDPFMAFLGGYVNSWRDHDVRRALRPLSDAAEATGAAIVVIRHLTKGVGPAIYRGGGSIGIIGAARSALLVARDPEDEGRRVLAVVKSNLAPEAPSLAFRVEDDGHGRSRITWDGTSPHRANALVAVPEEPEERSAQDDARDFLLQELAEGPQPARALQGKAGGMGISPKTLRGARERLGIKPRKLSFDGQWIWELPAPRCPQDAQDAPSQDIGTLGTLEGGAGIFERPEQAERQALQDGE